MRKLMLRNAGISLEFSLKSYKQFSISRNETSNSKNFLKTSKNSEIFEHFSIRFAHSKSLELFIGFRIRKKQKNSSKKLEI